MLDARAAILVLGITDTEVLVQLDRAQLKRMLVFDGDRRDRAIRAYAAAQIAVEFTIAPREVQVRHQRTVEAIGQERGL